MRDTSHKLRSYRKYQGVLQLPLVHLCLSMIFLSKRKTGQGAAQRPQPAQPKGRAGTGEHGGEAPALDAAEAPQALRGGVGASPQPLPCGELPPPSGRAGGGWGLVARDGRGTKAPGLVDVPHVPVTRQAPKASAPGGRFGGIQPMRGSESRRNTRGLGSCRRDHCMKNQCFSLFPVTPQSP